jgi:hypothetical protein
VQHLHFGAKEAGVYIVELAADRIGRRQTVRLPGSSNVPTAPFDQGSPSPWQRRNASRCCRVQHRVNVANAGFPTRHDRSSAGTIQNSCVP